MSGGEEPDDGMLDFGRILCLVHTEIDILLLKMIQHLRIVLKNMVGVGHLIVKVHEVPVTQDAFVLPIDLMQIVDIALGFPDLVLRQHHVLDIGDEPPDFPDIAVLGIAFVDSKIDLADDAVQFAVLRRQAKGLAAGMNPSEIINDLLGDAVDGPKLQILCRFSPEKRGIPVFHVLCRRNRVGHGQNRPGIDPPAENHIAQPGDKNAGLPAAGGSQQKDRAVHCVYGLLLLVIQQPGILFFEFRRLHPLLISPGTDTSCTRGRGRTHRTSAGSRSTWSRPGRGSSL